MLFTVISTSGKAPMRNVLPSWHYPAVIAGAFGLFAALQAGGAPLVASTYIPILATAGIVAWLEVRFPHRSEWRPGKDDVTTDLTFMTVVQLALPPLAGFLFAYALIEPARTLDLPLRAWWPHTWPIWIQGIVMVFVVDFLRYWLHRAAHENATLWRLHAVHHSVEQLYWLNTARFHPIEKTLQMMLDSVPFLLMGVDARVLSIYYIAYATNGFFQHCNIRLRYGLLNYLVGSAETHRWHHSREPREANANYGNTGIVWDLVFGTWFLPREREVGRLGLHEPYPRTFVGLMKAPFRSESS
jgi:sterol desaturase/sphingolipid hydroxylase (fatty acid hydroxylase superfamily)